MKNTCCDNIIVMQFVMTTQIGTQHLVITYQLLMILIPTLSQYQIQRTDPLADLTKTLGTFHSQACDGEVLLMKCPLNTKVKCWWLKQNYLISTILWTLFTQCLLRLKMCWHSYYQKLKWDKQMFLTSCI